MFPSQHNWETAQAQGPAAAGQAATEVPQHEMGLYNDVEQWFLDQPDEVINGFNDRELLREMEEAFNVRRGELDKHAKSIRGWIQDFKARKVLYSPCSTRVHVQYTSCHVFEQAETEDEFEKDKQSGSGSLVAEPAVQVADSEQPQPPHVSALPGICRVYLYVH